MTRHRRERRLAAILARLGWQRDPALWSIPCLDGSGRRAELSVRLGAGWVTLACPAAVPLYLRPGQAGRLRAALRQAIVDLERLGGAEMSGTERPGAGLSGRAPQPGAAAEPVAAPGRSVLHWRPMIRPTVTEIEAHLAAGDVDHDPVADDHPVADHAEAPRRSFPAA